MNKSVRNILIFAVVVVGCGFLGNAVNSLYHPPDAMQSLGVLIWLASPLAASLLLRSLGKDGWRDFGAAPHFKTGWPWYLTSLALAPAVTLAAVVVGMAVGYLPSQAAAPAGGSSLAALLVTGLGAGLVKNVFEEFSWRGYLTPRLNAVGASPLANALITGLIWAGWHIPYYLFFLPSAELARQTSLSAPHLMLAAFIALPLQALVYGELRLLSGSVWPAWLLHSLSNAVSFAITIGGVVPLAKGLSGYLLSPTTEGLLYSILFGLAGLALLRLRRKRTAPDRI